MDVRPLTLAAALAGCQPSPRAPPRRLVLVFVDTLRADHMGVYGYGRETTPRLDAWSREAAVFTSARSVAPWTLPSARSALSGRQPEAWDDGPVLMERLSSAGWATGAVISNVFLSDGSDIGRGVDDFRYGLLSPAPEQVSQALDFLAAHTDEDAAVLVHLIDPHLPYAEPPPHRERWAGPSPLPLSEGFLRGEVLAKMPAADHPDFAAARQHLIDRYDQNIRYVDDALAPLWAALGPQDVAIVFSDHGEEFWEHGGFEHGHALYEEVVRVPLLIRGPTVQAGRDDAPVSLLDVTPTALDLVGLPLGDVEGRALLSADAPAGAAPPLAIGRPLYGRDAWAVVEGTTKWLRGPSQTVRFDLGADPGEAAPQAVDRAVMVERLTASGVGAVSPVWRLEVDGTEKIAYFPGAVAAAQPAGIAAAWSVPDPHNRFIEPVRGPDGAEVTLTQTTRRLFPGEVYLQPADVGGPATLTLTPTDGAAVVVSGTVPLEASVGRHTVRLVPDIAVLPRPEAPRSLGQDLTEGLRALGYLE